MAGPGGSSSSRAAGNAAGRFAAGWHSDPGRSRLRGEAGARRCRRRVL